MKRTVLVLLIALTLSGCSTRVQAADPTPTPEPHLTQVAGVLAPDGAGHWYMLTGTHASIGIDYVEVLQSPSRIRLYLLFDATQVVTVMCAPDEKLAPLGYTCGTSAGLSTVDLYMGKPNGSGGYMLVNPAGSFPAGSNLWVNGWMYTLD